VTAGALRLLLGLLIALLLAACGGRAPDQESSTRVDGDQANTNPQRVVRATVVDVSGSAFQRNATMGSKVFKLALAEAAEHDGIAVVVAVTGDTAGESVMPVYVDFGARPPELPTDELFVNNWKQKLQTEALKAYKHWWDELEPAKGTDYVGAFLVVERALASLPNGDRQVWIVGDGFQCAAGWCMYRQRPDARTCRAWATALRRDGHLGRLHGASVTFIGGGLNARRVLSPTEQADLAACWAAIVKTAGGKTPAGWWNPARLMAGARP
jgi:hypothetical protein